jgi:hypothetical protein
MTIHKLFKGLNMLVLLAGCCMVMASSFPIGSRDTNGRPALKRQNAFRLPKVVPCMPTTHRSNSEAMLVADDHEGERIRSKDQRKMLSLNAQYDMIMGGYSPERLAREGWAPLPTPEPSEAHDEREWGWMA